MANGESLLEPYLDLIEGNRENLTANQSALEQLRIVGILRENNEDIAIRNLLYQEVFPLAWVKRHLRPSTTASSVPEPLPIASAAPISSEPLPPAASTAPRHSYVMAASIFLISVGLLIWFFGGQQSTPTTVQQEVSPSPREATLKPSNPGVTPTSTGESERLTEAQEKIRALETTIVELQNQSKDIIQPEFLTQAQDKINSLETTIAEYQRLAKEELHGLQTQRAQLEAQLESKEANVSALRTDMQNLNENLLTQQQMAQQAQLDFESVQADLKSALASTTDQLNAADQEVKALQTALLKRSSLAPSEIKELLTSKNQLEAKLTTASQQITKAQQDNRELTATLAQAELQARSQATRFEKERAQSETQLNTLQVELRQAKASLKQTEQHAQSQQLLAQQELTRLQQTRASMQSQLTKSQQLLSKQQARLTALSTDNTKYQEAGQKMLATNQALRSQLQASQQTETQLQTRLTQLEADVIRNKKTSDTKQATLQQERDRLSQTLTNTVADLETTKNRMITLTTQLASTKQELANRQVVMKDINTTSSEKTRLTENQLGTLAQARADLEARLLQNEGALSQAQQRILELEGSSNNTGGLTQDLETSKKENRTLIAKLSSTQQQLDDLQASLKRTAASSRNSGKIDASSLPYQRILPLITTAITSPSAASLSEQDKLLWARQAFLLSLRSKGMESASIDRSLRKGLRTAPVQLKGEYEQSSYVDIRSFWGSSHCWNQQRENALVVYESTLKSSSNIHRTHGRHIVSHSQSRWTTYRLWKPGFDYSLMGPF